ncbi:uncharacterized protein LOC143223267 [Tachypleus tridentatus]|uniref:uncharacterized protein LOC143223267 n=1 Tax=Tachypleus tridentatus TaxID=6853 RepID=UPI003FD60C59
MSLMVYLIALALSVLEKGVIAKPLISSDSEQTHEVRYRYESDLNTTKVMVEVGTIPAGIKTEITTFETIQDIREGDVKVDTLLSTDVITPNSSQDNVDTALNEFRVNSTSPTTIITGKTASEDSTLEQVNKNTMSSVQIFVDTTPLKIDLNTTELDKTFPNTIPAKDIMSAQVNMKSTVTEMTVNTAELLSPKANTSAWVNENIAKPVETSTVIKPPENSVETLLSLNTTASFQSIIETTSSEDTTLAQVVMDASLIKNKMNVTLVNVTIDTSQTKPNLDTAESIVVTDTILTDKEIIIRSSSTADESLPEIQTTITSTGVIKNASNLTFMNIKTDEKRSDAVTSIITRINRNNNSDNENISDIVINMTTTAAEVSTGKIMNTSLLETSISNIETERTTTNKPDESWISTTSATDVTQSGSVDFITDTKPTGTSVTTTPTDTSVSTNSTKTSSSVSVTDAFIDKTSSNSENMKDGKEKQMQLNSEMSIETETEMENNPLKTRSMFSESTLTITDSEVTDCPKCTTTAKRYRDLSIKKSKNNNSFLQSVQNTNEAFHETNHSDSFGYGNNPGFSTILPSTLTNDITDKIFQSLMDRIQHHWAEFINKMKQSVIEAWQAISSTMLSSLETLEV